MQDAEEAGDSKAQWKSGSTAEFADPVERT